MRLFEFHQLDWRDLVKKTEILMNFTVLTVVMATTTCAFTVTLGDPIRLSRLENGGMFTVGDKTFSDFSYAATEDMPRSDAVNVIPIQDCDGNFGVRFQGGFIDLPGGSPSDALITYAVMPARGREIVDVHLAGNMELVGPGIAQVVESFLPTFPNGPTLTIFDDGQVQQLIDWADLPRPIGSKLFVQKDILLRSDVGGVSASVSFVDQTFSQIPEPSSFVLLAGVVLLSWCRTRRS